MHFVFVSLPVAEDDVVNVKDDDDATYQHCAWLLGDFSES
jgi:hypothetical protein